MAMNGGQMRESERWRLTGRCDRRRRKVKSEIGVGREGGNKGKW
jgi:hypothetical protein